MKFSLHRFIKCLSAGCILPLLLTGCPPDLEVPPGFVVVDGFDFTTRDGQGAATEAVTEVWAFVDGAFFGAYPLPARIPIESAGPTEVELRAGIRQNGISSTPDFYEFYQPINRTIDVQPGETVDLGTLPLRYRPETRFALIESYEPGVTRIFDQPILGDAAITVQTDVVRSGRGSGRLLVDTANAIVEIASSTPLRGLLDQQPLVYLEVDFLSEAPGQWGVIGQRGGEIIRRFDPGFNPRDQWTKIYFDLTPIVTSADVDEVLLVFTALLPEGVTEAEVYLDNIKVVYF